jgi:hypothetical protein
MGKPEQNHDDRPENNPRDPRAEVDRDDRTPHSLAAALCELSATLKLLVTFLQANATSILLTRLNEMEKNIVITQTELATGLRTITAQQGKIATEQASKSDALLKEIADLKKVIDDGAVAADLESAFNDVKAAAQALDDVIPDPPAQPV